MNPSARRPLSEPAALRRAALRRAAFGPAFLFAMLAGPHLAVGREADLEIRDGDRVVLIGGTLVERDQADGWFETLLAARLPDRSITWRNLGWSGDTVFGDAQAYFGTTEDGYAHRLEHVRALDPTLVLVGYGTNESFDGAAGLERFRVGLNRLLDDLQPTRARIVLLTPLAHETLPPPFPDPAPRNAALDAYAGVVREVAAARGMGFVDLLAWHRDLLERHPTCRLTDNGIHPTPAGYRVLASKLADALGVPPEPTWKLALDASGRARLAEGVSVSRMEPTSAGLRFDLTDTILPVPIPSDSSCLDPEAMSRPRVLEVHGLAPGSYVLKRDGVVLARFDAGSPARVELEPTGIDPRTEALRALVIDKNRLYFHRWRPQNETYLFGFRKHEQGRNAAEIPRFDPLIAELESRIAVLRRPVARTFEITRVEVAR